MVILTLYPRFFHILTVGMESLLSLLLLSMIWFYSDGFFKGEGDLKGGFVLGILCGSVSNLELYGIQPYIDHLRFVEVLIS
ncbi:MAG: hypothetical protein B6D57_01925 [Candidatus Coatesbacteria bacterium 4484_99]|uniref:Uncharacterized protein n=1 Tax=Candidatus Coatesbacteria bacterium 4484_99 TaxID=1970774 RepID=A0A1W9S3F2_9BACT|nr:MAG: hypothetical protein B6D57_01925 [Candidatus Coatesbacteria bacterium 4484_99]